MSMEDVLKRRQERAIEKIDRAAILHDGQIYMVPRPGRHHDVIHLMASQGLGPECMREQGFVTTLGRFVSRTAARRIAERQNQIIKTTGPAHILFSEDVW